MFYSISIRLVLIISMKINAELYSSVEELKVLLKTEKRVIDDLEVYIQREEKRLSTYKRYLHQFKTEYDKARRDVPFYIEDPINGYRLIRRLTTDLDFLNKTINAPEYTNNITPKHPNVTYPDMEDLTGAAKGIARLQAIYQLDIKDLAEGMVNEATDSTPMTASDCYELSRVLYNEGDYNNTLEWMSKAFEKYYIENITHYFTEYDILDHINKTCYQLGIRV